ncbi:MAG TPA: hypothetical protein VIG42_09775 [Solirubrobacteraceae bacterium]|jgi:hypothetical protein
MGAHAGEQPSELHRRREALATEVAELHWNLGGLTYEMAIRDHFRIDVLVRRAAMLQEREAELAEVERLLHMREGSIAGACASCGAVRSRGAVFCWQCGAQMMERTVAGGNAHRDTARPVVAPAVSRATDAASRAATRGEELGIGRPLPIP